MLWRFLCEIDLVRKIEAPLLSASHPLFHLVHDPRRRQCRLASVTSFTLVDGRLARVDYAEPAGDLLPPKKRTFAPGA